MDNIIDLDMLGEDGGSSLSASSSDVGSLQHAQDLQSDIMDWKNIIRQKVLKKDWMTQQGHRQQKERN